MTNKTVEFKTPDQAYEENIQARKAMMKQRVKLIMQIKKLDRDIEGTESAIIEYNKQRGTHGHVALMGKRYKSSEVTNLLDYKR